ncbi:TPA: hypothetical protein JBF73_07810 [Legionella pneumophila]|nr:hypothetical protein [Legionella pneumophila]
MSVTKQIFSSIGIALLFIGILKFNTISETLYTPQDVTKAWEYIDDLISLAGMDNGSCSVQATQARKKIVLTNIMLDSIIQDHKYEHRYKTIAAIKVKMDRSRSPFVLC